MRQINTLPSRSVIKNNFKYDKSGNLVRNDSDRFSGTTRPTDGYRVIGFQGKFYYAHRLIWIYFNGSIPKGFEIDHIDGDTTNNRIENLRLATHKENQLNRNRLNSNSTTGYRGVQFIGTKPTKPYRAYYTDTTGTDKHIGYFDTALEASNAARVKRLQAYGPYSAKL